MPSRRIGANLNHPTMPRWTEEELKRHEARVLMQRRAFSEEENATLRAYYESHKDKAVELNVIAAEMGRTRWSVAMQAFRLGLGDMSRPASEAARASMSIVQKEIGQRPEIKAQRALSSKAAIKKFGHPRGFLGHKRTPKDLAQIKAGVKKAWADPNHIYNSNEHRQRISDRFSKLAAARPAANAFSRAKYGVRADLGSIFFRSAWEANYARYLNFLIRHEGLIERWQYEPETFWFVTIKRGCRSYKPDFKVFFKNGSREYHEVKGWMYPRAKTALKRMAKYYPKVPITLIDEARYKAISSQCKHMIKEWE